MKPEVKIIIETITTTDFL